MVFRQPFWSLSQGSFLIETLVCSSLSCLEYLPLNRQWLIRPIVKVLKSFPLKLSLTLKHTVYLRCLTVVDRAVAAAPHLVFFVPWFFASRAPTDFPLILLTPRFLLAKLLANRCCQFLVLLIDWAAILYFVAQLLTWTIRIAPFLELTTFASLVLILVVRALNSVIRPG